MMATAPVESTPMRERIVDAASDILVEMGLGGLTFAETGRRVGLKITSVTHYFKRRDDLAEACFYRALDRLNDLVATAEKQPDPASKVRCYIDANISILRAARLGQGRPIPVLSGIMTLDAARQEPLMERYHELFRRVRALFVADRNPAAKDVLDARTHVLLEVVFWLPNALRLYAVEDFERLGDHLYRILRYGLADTHGDWEPRIFEVSISLEPRGLRDLIVAATPLINEQGYKGASINKVVGSLDLTKGSFYHHLESRDALTLECFRASYQTLLASQRTAKSLETDGWTRLTSVVASLINYQFSSAGNLLRTTALQGLPLELRQDVLRQAAEAARGFADLVTDGFVHGNGRPNDAAIAGQVVTAMISSAYVMNNWARRRPLEDAIRIYAGTVIFGLFDDR